MVVGDENLKPGMFYACMFSASSHGLFAVRFGSCAVEGNRRKAGQKKIRSLEMESKKQTTKKNQERSFPKEAAPSKPLP